MEIGAGKVWPFSSGEPLDSDPGNPSAPIDLCLKSSRPNGVTSSHHLEEEAGDRRQERRHISALKGVDIDPQTGERCLGEYAQPVTLVADRERLRASWSRVSMGTPLIRWL